MTVTIGRRELLAHSNPQKWIGAGFLRGVQAIAPNAVAAQSVANEWHRTTRPFAGLTKRSV
jgi:hypothetical protein